MKQLTRLFIPICLETLFYMLSGMVDTLMLSAVGDYAVGAVGTANSYIGIFIIMFSIISSGMVSVMTQADRELPIRQGSLDYYLMLLRACLWLYFYFREQEPSFVW